MPDITEADRSAAAAYYDLIDNGKGHRAENAKRGNMDDLPTVQAFAAHREATEAAIVAWLRGPMVPDHSDEGGCPFDRAARMIEAGAHREKG